MTTPQLLAATLFALTLAAFVWDRVRYDVVAVGALVACVALGLLAPEAAFAGFGNAAVITVAAVLVLSHALTRSGAVQLLGEFVARGPSAAGHQIALICAVGAAFSAFMNNVGALAIMMPVALQMAARTGIARSLILMPLSFSTMLGGMCTLIGTPPNLLIAGFRERYAQAAFGFFDFAPVGLAVTVAGIAFMSFAGRRLLPHDRQGQKAGLDLFDVGHYVTELRIPEASPLVGKTVSEVEATFDDRLLVVSLLRGKLRTRRVPASTPLAVDDVLIVQADAALLQDIARKGEVELVAAHSRDGEKADVAAPQLVETSEVVIAPSSWLQGQTARGLQLRTRWNVNLLAISHKGQPMRSRLRDTPLQAGDVLLLEGNSDAIGEAVRALGCLPLANRGIALEPSRIVAPVAIFALAIAAVALGIAPAAIAFVAAALAVVVLGIVPPREVYGAIDWPVIVLLGAMIPVGGVLESSGLAELLAGEIARLGATLPPVAVLAGVMMVTMAITPMLNNAATVIVMTPVVIGVAQLLNVNPDALVMAVAIGASCDFLTPFGHQNNTLILSPGGYRFSDFWRLGLPLDLIVIVIATFLLPIVFPLTR